MNSKLPFPRILFYLATVLATYANVQAANTPPTPEPKALPRTTRAIKIDGDLSDDGWKGALIDDKFYETSPGNNTPPKVKTTVFLTYDDHYFYIGIKADDPDPKKIRAPFVERDQVIGTDDNIAVFLDTRNDKRTAMELRVSPRGIQADGIFDDSNNSEDFSPDFFYDTAAKITTEGWQAEFRIPMTTLRYPKSDPQTWGILIWRNYPRDFRYAFHTSPIERGSNCLVCHTMELTGITQLPSSHHIVAAPYATATELQHRKDPNNLSSPLTNDSVNGDVGVDVKWNPSANSAVDATVNPDFSQVESDVPQIEVNQRFALFFPEKRPFFLEGSNLFNTPIQIAYTRTITDPQWGGRFTGKLGSANYTVLASEDNGGGLVVLPGPVSSAFAPQDFKSFVSLGRLKDDFGPSYGSFMFTDREISGGGHNRVLGPDGQWRPNDADVFTGQVLFSSTQDPFLAPFFNGQSANSHAMQFRWDHQVTKFDWTLLYNDLGDKFRADLGFVPQVGFREGLGVGAMRFYPQSGPIAFMRTYVTFDKFFLQNNDDLGHDYYPGIFLIGSRNLNAQFEFHNNKVDVGNGLLTQNYLFYFVQMDPFRHLPRFTFQGRTGDLIDFENGRVGKGTRLSLEAQVRPTDHLTLIGDTIREWLNLDLPTANGRLYTADIERLKAVYVFDSRSFLRLIGQYVTTKRDPALYTFPTPVRDGTFLGSILYGYRLNWQTVLFVGYGDNGVIDESNSLVRTGRSFFLKVSYAIQH